MIRTRPLGPLVLLLLLLPGSSFAAEVFWNRPHCERCGAADKQLLLRESPLLDRLVATVDGAERSVEVAQFSFSDRRLEEALLAAHGRGVTVRLAVDAGQEQPGRAAVRLRDAGVPVRFVRGKVRGGEVPDGLQHDKFVLVDGSTLVTGSMNWSSTGLSINAEHAVLFERDRDGGAMLDAFGCHFEAMWAGDFAGAGRCRGEGVAFSPGAGGPELLRRGLRGAASSIDVLMHHLLFDKLLRDLTRAAKRGVRVRILLNEGDRGEATGRRWEELLAAGAELRFKRNNEDAYQLMHHKLAVVDGRLVLDGSGNWSGSAFFNNYENWWRSEDAALVASFSGRFRELWELGVTPAGLDAGRSPAQERADEETLTFGTLHAHHPARDPDSGALLDDGRPLRLDEGGEPVDVSAEVPDGDWAAYAFGRAAEAGLDFLALTPHTSDARPDDGPTFPNMSPEGWERLLRSAESFARANPSFAPLVGAEWSTNGSGNHVAVLGTRTLPRLPRGEFRRLWDEWLPAREAEGEDPVVVLCHPRTYPGAPVGPMGEADPSVLAGEAAEVEPDGEEDGGSDRHPLAGTWDQVFGLLLTEVPRAGERGRKFNDYGLDEESPVREALPSWIAGKEAPDRAAVRAAMVALAARTARWVRGMEVFLARGNELGGEVAVNPSLLPVDRDDPEAGLVRRDKVHSDWDAYLLAGFRPAPVAPHDNHYANWGRAHTTRTVASVRPGDPDGPLDALRRRAVYASEDADLRLRYVAQGQAAMGSELRTTAGTVELSFRVDDPSHDGWRLRVHRGLVGGSAVEGGWETEVDEGRWQSVEVPLPSSGTFFLYLELERDEGRVRAVSAPIWVRRE